MAQTVTDVALPWQENRILPDFSRQKSSSNTFCVPYHEKNLVARTNYFKIIDVHIDPLFDSNLTNCETEQGTGWYYHHCIKNILHDLLEEFFFVHMVYIM